MCRSLSCILCFFFNDTATTEIYTLSLHDALPISAVAVALMGWPKSTVLRTFFSLLAANTQNSPLRVRSEEHTSELQSLRHLVCRLLLEKKKKHINNTLQHDNNMNIHQL